jgi:acyl-CoA reductase-like NAD-dependent aldehyde dehydrogenase
MTRNYASRGLYIGGDWVPTTKSERVINPADESIVGIAPVGSVAEADAAIEIARKCFDNGMWSQAAPGENHTPEIRQRNARPS